MILYDIILYYIILYYIILYCIILYYLILYYILYYIILYVCVKTTNWFMFIIPLKPETSGIWDVQCEMSTFYLSG
jgi:hypothetical protein